MEIETMIEIQTALAHFKKGWEQMSNLLKNPEILTQGVKGEILFKSELNKHSGILEVKASINLELPGA